MEHKNFELIKQCLFIKEFFKLIRFSIFQAAPCCFQYT